MPKIVAWWIQRERTNRLVAKEDPESWIRDGEKSSPFSNSSRYTARIPCTYGLCVEDPLTNRSVTLGFVLQEHQDPSNPASWICVLAIFPSSSPTDANVKFKFRKVLNILCCRRQSRERCLYRLPQWLYGSLSVTGSSQTLAGRLQLVFRVES